MNLLAQAPELFLLLQESNRIHVRQIQSMQAAPSRADAGDQSNQDGRVRGPLGIGFYCSAVDEALLKIIQTLLEDNITQLHLMNQSPGLVAHRVEVLAQGAGGRQFQPQMFEPESERDRLLQQQPGVLVFAAAVKTAQHQEKIDDIGIGAGPAYLQFDVIDFELAQLQAAVWADRGSGRPGTLRRRGATAFSFWHAGRDLRRCAPRSRVRRGRFGEFRSENRSIGCRWGSGRLTVEVGWPDQERSPKVFRSSLICSQSESYKFGSAAPELTHRLAKKTGLPFRRTSS